jgi:hypothetical protein
MVTPVPAQISKLRPRLPATPLRRRSLPLLTTHCPLSFCRPCPPWRASSTSPGVNIFPVLSSFRILPVPKRANSSVYKSLPPLSLLFAPFSEVSPFVFNRLQPLLRKHPGWGWVPQSLQAVTSALLAPKPAKHAFVTPLFATLTHSCSCKSFACHSYENTRDGGANGGATDALHLLQFAASVGGSWR